MSPGLRRTTERSAPARARRAVRVLLVVLVAVAAAAGAVGALGGVRSEVGPLTASLQLGLSARGGTQVDLAPFGRIRMDTHVGPLRLSAGVEEVRPAEVGPLVRQGLGSREVREGITADLRAGVVDLAARSALVGLLAAAAACALVFHRWRAVLVGVVAAATGMAACAGVAVTTFRSTAVAEPAFDGLLAQAPALLGEVADASVALDAHARRVSELTSNIAQLYTALDAPTGDPSQDAVRLLWVSDIHNDPSAYEVMTSLVDRFDVDAIVDTGDSTDLGSVAENSLHTAKGGFGVPYAWVRGNHDSSGTQEFLASLPGVVVLDDGEVVEVAGLRLAGIGDPRFRPVRAAQSTEGVLQGRAQLQSAGARLAEVIRSAPEEVDVALVHEPSMAVPLLGTVPLVLQGHTHERAARTVDGTLELTQGSSGGAGLRSFDGGAALPLQMSVLHLAPDDGRLLAVDDITIGGVGQRSVSLERRTAASYEEEAEGEAPRTGTAEASDTPSSRQTAD